jgi:hypothetical protein
VQALNLPYNWQPVAHTEKTDLQFQVIASTGSPYTANIFAGGILVKNPD